MTESGSSADSRLQELADRMDVTDLISRLGVVLDEKRIDDLITVFTEDATGQFPSGGFDGVAELAEYGRSTIPAFEQLQHVITNVLVDLNGDRAEARANLVSFNVPSAEDPATHFDVGGLYRFEAVRQPEGWKLSRVELREVWTAGTMDEAWLENANYSTARE